MNIETAQKLVEFYQSQLELTPQYKCLEVAKKNLAKLKDKERAKRHYERFPDHVEALEEEIAKLLEK